MAEIVNLRQARKRQRRADAERQAAVKREIHGQPAAIRKGRRLENELDAKRLDQHRRTPED